MKTLLSLAFSLILIQIQAQVRLEVGEFNQIETYDKLNIKLIQAERNSIEAIGSKADKVEFINKNGLLKIRMKAQEFLQGEDVKVYVYYKNLKSIHANEGSFVTSDETLESPDLLLNAKEGAYIVLDLDVDHLEIKTNTAGRIETSGFANVQSVVCNSGGGYDGENLQTTFTEVTVNAGGEAYVNASEKVTAKTRAGGNIHISGDAQVSHQTIIGGNIYIN